MALTERETLSLDQAFDRLLKSTTGSLPNGISSTFSQVVTDIAAASSSGASSGNISVNPSFSSQAPITLSVKTTGSDSNPGTDALPFLTIQAAIDSLPKRIRNLVTITVGAGSFAGFIFEGFTIEHYAALAGTLNQTLQQAAVTITGTMATATVASGVTSGTIASATAGGNGTITWGTATVTGAGWTVDDLRGKFIRIDSGTGAGQLRPIASNTATVITVPGGWTAPTGATFSIVSSATTINAVPTTRAPTGGLVTISGLNVMMEDATQGEGYDFRLNQIKLAASGLNGVFVRSYGRLQFLNLEFGSPISTGINVGYSNSNTVDVWHSFFNGGNAVLFGNNNQGALLQNVLVATTQVSVLVGSTILAQSNLFYNMAAVAYSIDGGEMVAQGDIIDGVTPSTKVGYRLQIGTGVNQHYNTQTALIQGSSISNCGTGIRLIGHNTFAGLFSPVGSGNTVGIEVQRGAGACITSSTTLTGTTELSIDGNTTFTLAAMRAATPKVIKNIEYGTMVYE